jgi:1-acyl-sn-glycerol-3-phosphate acyltransferase
MLNFYQITKAALKSYFMIVNRTYDVKGCATLPSGPKIIAMNHTPGCDPLHLPFLLDDAPHFLLQDGLFRVPVIGKILKETGQIPVQRGTERARDAKEQAIAMLREGKTIAVFPEGKDVPLGQRIPAKTGVVRMALETGVPIIPIGLYTPPQNLTRLDFEWEGTPRCGAWQFSGKSYMRIGAPWLPNPLADIHAETEELMNRIYYLVSESERESQCVSHFLLNPIHQW